MYAKVPGYMSLSPLLLFIRSVLASLKQTIAFQKNKFQLLQWCVSKTQLSETLYGFLVLCFWLCSIKYEIYYICEYVYYPES